MREELLHFIWRYQQYDAQDWTTSEGLAVQVIHPGQLNEHAGPDFLNAQLQIGDTLWHGHVEIHERASEWDQHRHSDSTLYDNVIAHVVYVMDRAIHYPSGEAIPTLSLAHRIPPHLLRSYQDLTSSLRWIPCSGMLANYLSEIGWSSWSQRLMIERLSQRHDRLRMIFQASASDWSQSWAVWLGYVFGLQPNADSLQDLLARVDIRLLQKYADRPLYAEALLYGQAGLLSGDYSDAYPRRLKDIFSFLSHKHSLPQITGQEWRFHRMRPPSYPTVRISQLARLLHRSPTMLRDMLELSEVQDLIKYIDIEAHPYWKTHSKFDSERKESSVRTGADFLDRVIINGAAPFIFFYGKSIDREEYMQRAIDWLYQLGPENNVIIRRWRAEGLVAQHAAHSQALYHLKRSYCEPFLCQHCHWGHAILTQNPTDDYSG